MTWLSARVAACAVLMLLPAAAPAAPAHDPSGKLTDEQRSRLDATLLRFVRHTAVPGLAVGVVDGGQPQYVGAFGVRDVNTDAPVTSNTLFHIASISKTFTATAILQLAEQHKLALSDPLENYLPEFTGSGITLEQLLTHTAGLDDWIDPAGAKEDDSVARYVARVAKHRRAYPPGQGWEYCDADFNLLGAVIEKVSGQSYPDYLAEHVFAPVGMTRTSARMPADDENFAWPHTGDVFAHHAKEHPYDRAFVPSSGVESTIPDMLRWALANLQRDPALLSADSFDALFARHVKTKWHGISMGLGWQLERHQDVDRPFHTGGDPGFQTLLMLYPRRQRAIIILSNGDDTDRFEIRDAIEAFLARELK